MFWPSSHTALSVLFLSRLIKTMICISDSQKAERLQKIPLPSFRRKTTNILVFIQLVSRNFTMTYLESLIVKINTSVAQSTLGRLFRLDGCGHVRT